MENNTTESPDLLTDHLDEIKRINREGYELTIKKARNALFWVAGLVFLAEIISTIRDSSGFDMFVFVFALLISGIFIALALWTKKKPYTALLTGLVLYIAYILFVAGINGYVDGTTGFLKGIFSGIIAKAIILGILIRAIPDARALQEDITEA